MNVSSKNAKTNDEIIRVKLVQDILQSHESSWAVEEFDVVGGKARADVVSVHDGKLHAYEIKSDVDTLLRLPSQVRYYNQVFSMVTLVVGAEHAADALYIIPDWWGVMVARVVDNGLVLLPVRDAKENRNIDYDSVSDLLHRGELIELLNRHAPGGSYRSMSKIKLMNEVRREVDTELLLSSSSGFISCRESQLKVAF